MRLLSSCRATWISWKPQTNELNILISSINQGQGTLGKLATDDSLYLELHGASAALRRILETFEEDPRQYLEHLKLIDFF